MDLFGGRVSFSKLRTTPRNLAISPLAPWPDRRHSKTPMSVFPAFFLALFFPIA